jgi:uncharacterized iron-regulated membrane protein
MDEGISGLLTAMLAFAIIALGIAMAAAAIYWSYRRRRAGGVRAIERVYREEDGAQERERRNA